MLRPVAGREAGRVRRTADRRPPVLCRDPGSPRVLVPADQAASAVPRADSRRARARPGRVRRPARGRQRMNATPEFSTPWLADAAESWPVIARSTLADATIVG